MCRLFIGQKHRKKNFSPTPALYPSYKSTDSGLNLGGVPEDEYGEDLDDGPLVVVPDDVADALQRVQEPHERGVRSAEMNFLYVSD